MYYVCMYVCMYVCLYIYIYMIWFHSLMPVANPFAKMTLSGPLIMANTSHDLLHSGHTGSFWQSAQSSRVAWSGFRSHRWSRLKGQAIFLTESVEWSSGVVQIFQKVFPGSFGYGRFEGPQRWLGFKATWRKKISLQRSQLMSRKQHDQHGSSR